MAAGWEVPEDFDPIFYLYANPDLPRVSCGFDPVEHFARYGYAEGRQHRLPSYPEAMALDFAERQLFFRRAFTLLSYNATHGVYAEFGAGGGASLSLAYREAQRFPVTREFWTFDSFEGLPAPSNPLDEHPHWHAGAYAITEEEFRQRCRLIGINQSKLHVVPGWYSESLRPGPNPGPTEIALAYIDCDLYSSATAVLPYLQDKLVNGAIIAFDDYFCHGTAGRAGENLAFKEFQGDRRDFIFEPYLNIGWHGASFIAYTNANS